MCEGTNIQKLSWGIGMLSFWPFLKLSIFKTKQNWLLIQSYGELGIYIRKYEYRIIRFTLLLNHFYINSRHKTDYNYYCLIDFQVKIQKMRSNLEEKLMKRMGVVHRKAEELRESARKQHSEQMTKANQHSQKIFNCSNNNNTNINYHSHFSASCGCFPCNNGAHYIQIRSRPETEYFKPHL